MKSLHDDVRATNRRALLVFVVVLAGVVLATAATVLVLQRQHLRADAEVEIQIELALLGELSTDALLRSDYSTVEGLVQRWLEKHDYLHQITAVMPNGFVLVETRKPGAIQEPLLTRQEISHLGRPLLSLRVVSDFAQIRGGFAAVVWQVSAVAVVLVLLLGWLLWQTLQRTALAPLGAQIRQREDKERELVERTVALEAALRELEAFSYSVSHDLRTPLRAIDGYCHALIEDYGATLDDTARQYLSAARTAAQRMGRLIDSLLALSRLSHYDLHVSEVNLSALAREVLERLARQSPGRPVAVTVMDGLHVQADAYLMHIVLDNLLGNAWKYTQRVEAPRIEFGARPEAGATVYFVRDNGAGFDMQYADKLFRPFQRLHAPTEFEGSGIGLATVARIIERHGGRIWAESTPGTGALFSFTLPGGAPSP